MLGSYILRQMEMKSVTTQVYEVTTFLQTLKNPHTDEPFGASVHRIHKRTGYSSSYMLYVYAQVCYVSA